jgi:hypothetical protein
MDKGEKMLKKILLVLGFAGVAALAVTGAALATGGSDGGATDQTLVLTDITQHETDLDADQSHSFTAGDQFIITDVLKRSGMRVGKLHAICEAISVNPRNESAVAHCVATANLAAGSIEFAGTATFSAASGDANLAVTGGTGRYDEIHGQVHIHEVSNTRSILTIDIDA